MSSWSIPFYSDVEPRDVRVVVVGWRRWKVGCEREAEDTQMQDSVQEEPSNVFKALLSTHSAKY